MSGNFKDGFIAMHKRLERKVFLKERKMHPLYPVQGLEKEILLKARHRGIPPVFDEIMIENKTYIVMDYIEGESLRALLDRKEMTMDLFENILSSMAEVLSYLTNFKRPLVHGDIKPANILISGEEVYLIDFDSSVFENKSGILIGCSPGYLPPWFKRNKKERVYIGAVLDLYALFLTLSECLACLPFSVKKIYYSLTLSLLKILLFFCRRRRNLWILDLLKDKRKKEKKHIKGLIFLVFVELAVVLFSGGERVDSPKAQPLYKKEKRGELLRKQAMDYFVSGRARFAYLGKKKKLEEKGEQALKEAALREEHGQEEQKKEENISVKEQEKPKEKNLTGSEGQETAIDKEPVPRQDREAQRQETYTEEVSREGDSEEESEGSSVIIREETVWSEGEPIIESHEETHIKTQEELVEESYRIRESERERKNAD